jgi:hypothetical protein
VTRRLVGATLGVLIGMGLVIHFDRSDGVSKNRVTKTAPASSSISVEASNVNDARRLRKLTEQQAEEIAHLRRLRETDEALELLRTTQTRPDPARPDLARYRSLSSRELNNEIETAVDEAANYTAEGEYAPERHKDLHRRINSLWDLRGLTDRQNKWLAEAAKELNELAVQHAEEAVENGRNDEVIGVAKGLGAWAFRLNDEQEKRLIVAVETVQSRYRS